MQYLCKLSIQLATTVFRPPPILGSLLRVWVADYYTARTQWLHTTLVSVLWFLRVISV